MLQQRESYTNPDLKFEDTVHFQHRQQALRQSSQSSSPILPHKVPFLPSKYIIPSRRIEVSVKFHPGFIN